MKQTPQIAIAILFICFTKVCFALNAPPWLCETRLKGKSAIKFSANLQKLSSGRSMYYEQFDVKGAKKTFLLIHGATKNGHFFSQETPIVKLLTAKGFSVVTVDLHGNSGGRTPLQYRGQIPYQDNVDDVADLIVKLGLKNVVLTGHSYGGFIALHTAGKESVADRLLGVYAASPYLQNLAVRVVYDYERNCRGESDAWNKACDYVKEKTSGYMEDLEKRTDKITRWLVEGLPISESPSIPNGIFIRIINGDRNSMLPDAMRSDRKLAAFLKNQDLDFNISKDFIAQARSSAASQSPYREMLERHPVHLDLRRKALVDGDYVDHNRAVAAIWKIEEQIFFQNYVGGHMWPAEYPEIFVSLITHENWDLFHWPKLLQNRETGKWQLDTED